jgi:poly(ADP-ribose) glycohydrolase ARH3
MAQDSPPAPRVEDAAAGALLGTFVGDALGMPWEGSAAERIPERLEMFDDRLGSGTYTDDTQMMIALAESLLRCDVVDEEDLASTFVVHHDPRRGYGSGTTRVLELLRQGVPVDHAAARVFDGRGSLGNGAAMRIAPVSVRFFEDAAVLTTQARRSARVTHAHPVAIDAAVAQAGAVGAALDGLDPFGGALAVAATREVRGALEATAERVGSVLTPDALRESGSGVPPIADQSVAAAVVAGCRATSFEAVVTAAIRAGGDTDTVGAMAGAIAGARFGASAIPSRWLDALEEGERGRRHVEGLAAGLVERALSPVVSRSGRRRA